ncbi:MAG: SLC13 family permease, partial [Nitrospinaceae bacterium]|nr:SLC13 family permease [Nitrospinaceae bacterium]
MATDSSTGNSGGFAKTTDFKWLGVGIAVFALLALMPTPESMADKARELFAGAPPEVIAQKAQNMKIIIALLGTCTVFFATEAIPMPAVALLIGLVQLFFGITEPSKIVGTYAHDAVWFIAGSLAIGSTLVKFGLDKRIGMLVVKLSGTKTRNIVLGLLLGTAIPSAFINEASIAPMYIPIALSLYTLTNKTIPAPRLGKLLMMSIAIGCMVGAPM